MLCYFEERSYKSAAETLEITEGALRGRLAKARDHLRLAFERFPRRTASKRAAPVTTSECGVPFALLAATTRAAVAFSCRVPDKTGIPTSIVKLAEGALGMMFATRIMRLLVVVFVCGAATAAVGLQTNGAALPAGPVRGQGAGAQPAAPINSDPKREQPRDILIQADAIRTNAENDEVSVDGPGTLTLWVDRGLLTSSVEEPAKGLHSDPVLLKITWTVKMKLVGRTKDDAGRPSCRIEFQGQPNAVMNDALVHCNERMIIHTTQPVPLAQVQCASKEPANENLAARPQTKIARIQANRKVVVVGRIVDLDRSAILHQQRLEANDTVIYDRRTGSIHVAGPGLLILHEPQAPAPPPAQAKANALTRTEISFNEEMTAKLGAGKNENTLAREAEFSGSVTITRTDVADTRAWLDPELAARQGGYLISDKLRFVSAAGKPSPQPARLDSHFFKATWQVRFHGANCSIQSDEAHLFFPEGLMYACGTFTGGTIRGGVAHVVELDLATGKYNIIEKMDTSSLSKKFAAKLYPASRPSPAPTIQKSPAH